MNSANTLLITGGIGFSWHFNPTFSTISKESPIFSFPAINLSQSMERPEAKDADTIILTGFDSDVVLNAVAMSVEEQKNYKYKSIAQEYQIDNTSSRVVKLILGNTKLSNKWWGVK